ncbi:hypothetical protein [Bdellovibrio sp.]|uniref:hypothetical protein n=1 Tax=Bdellovibrio sp. TaxID=28201 RepID=UPI0039E626EA
MKTLLGPTLLILLSACSHTINFRASHFAAPVVSEKQWGGHVALVGTAVTKVTVVNDITSNPPSRNTLTINEDVDAADLLLVRNIGLDASLSLYRGLDLYLDNSLLGVRFQFLNHGAGPNNWVASLLGSYGERETSTTQDPGGTAKSKVISSQAGISLGYTLEYIVPYFSYIHEAHEVTTDVTNNSGNFGPYKDKGTHQYYSIGIASHGKGLVYGVEYSRLNISWDRSSKAEPQDALGMKLGFAW